MDSRSVYDWDDLANPLSHHSNHVRLCFFAGVPEETALEGGVAICDNLVANLVFTPIQFGMRNLSLAAADIVVVWLTIIWMSIVVWKHYRWVSLAQIPYFVWVSLATILQLSITWHNR